MHQMADDARLLVQVSASQHTRNRGQNSTSGVKEECAGAASWVEHADFRRWCTLVVRLQYRGFQPLIIERLLNDQTGEPVRRVVLAVELAILFGHDRHIDVAQHIRFPRTPIVPIDELEQIAGPPFATGRVRDPRNEAVGRRRVPRAVEDAGDIAGDQHQQAVIEEQRDFATFCDLNAAAAHQIVPEAVLRNGCDAVGGAVPNLVKLAPRPVEEIRGIGGHPRLARLADGERDHRLSQRVGRSVEFLLVQRPMRGMGIVVARGGPLPRPPAHAVGQRADPRRVGVLQPVPHRASFAGAQREHIAL